MYDHLMGRAVFPMPTPHLAIYAGNAEVMAVARPVVVMGPPSDGMGANAREILVGPLPGSGVATSAALVDEGGRALTVRAPLAEEIPFVAGDSLRFTPGSLVFTLL